MKFFTALSPRAGLKKGYKMALFSMLYEPDERLSYSFLLLGYASFSALGLLLFILEKFVVFEELDGKGYWLIFTPFVPCLLWSYLMNRAAQAKNKVK